MFSALWELRGHRTCFLGPPPVLLSSQLFLTHLRTWLALSPPAVRAAGCSPGEQHGLVAAEGDCSLAETLGIWDPLSALPTLNSAHRG